MGRRALLQQGHLRRGGPLLRRRGPLLRDQGQGQRHSALLLRDARNPEASSGGRTGIAASLLELARGLNFREHPFRDCLKSGSSNAWTVSLVSLRRANGRKSRVSVVLGTTSSASQGLFRQSLHAFGRIRA